MKTCRRLKENSQVFNAKGDVRICSWVIEPDTIIGNLVTSEFPEIMHSERAKEIRKRLAEGDLSRCCNTCPHVIDEKRLEEMMVPYEEENIPDYPETLSISFEQYCNYNCTCCESSFQHNCDTDKESQKRTYDIIESRIRDALPYVKRIGGHGTAELFCSPRTLKLLSEWRPRSAKEECSVGLETNGSLFNERNWAKIENLGEYDLSVNITVMSYNDKIYQYLSGTDLSVNVLKDSLKFVASLREKGIINHLTIATVVQEANFWDLPDFVKMSIDEFNADRVRLRPIFPGGIYDKNIQWFFDVRNPYHPYYKLYQRVMSDPIFDHPKVYKWSSDADSSLGPHPALNDKWETHSTKGKIWSVAREVLPYRVTKRVEKEHHKKRSQPSDEWGGVVH